jgi:predicted nucleotidyltransferase component of viral defense system
MSLKELAGFSLVGGTALALRLGHRKSVDLDFFSEDKFEIPAMRNELKKYFGERINIVSSEKNRLGIFSTVDGLKIDICKHPFPLIRPLVTEEGIRFWSFEDIAASKVYAISMRATKKDFWDIDRLLDIFSIEEIASFYSLRYKQNLAIAVSKMLTYFDEAEETKEPECLMGKKWAGVKKSIFKKINHQTK